MSMLAEPQSTGPIPVWLVTGYLGSGKTTLLAQWLSDPELANAAVIINELGEAGFDDAVLARSLSSAGAGTGAAASALLAGRCVCCSGLDDLQQTLAQLWWARLWRERPWFDSVVIETTGVADPGPILQAFAEHDLLRQRYRLQAVITTAAASMGPAALAGHAAALQQLALADVLVMTKTDVATADSAFTGWIRKHNREGLFLSSAQASLSWRELRTALAAKTGLVDSQALHPGSPPTATPAHLQRVQTYFEPVAHAAPLEDWPQWLGPHLQAGVQRIKGFVRLPCGTLVSLQWCVGDAAPRFDKADPAAATRLGFTVIRDLV